MKTTKFLMMAAMATAFAACSNDENVVNDGPVEAQISAGVSGPMSRANDDSWEADEIGVMVTSATKSDMANLYKNVRYTTTATGTGTAKFTAKYGGIFFQDAVETVIFAAYGPYQPSADAKTLPGTDGDGVITSSSTNGLSTTDQSTRDKQKAFDFIYTSGWIAQQAAPIIRFNGLKSFAHVMTRLVIIVKTSADYGFTAEQVKNGIYRLRGLIHEGTFNVTTGKAQATGTADDVNFWSLSDNSLKTEGETTQCTFTSILYPQTLGKALYFNAIIDNQHYNNSLEIKPALEAGKSYEYTITVKKTGIEVSGCTITAWNPNDMGGVDAVM